MNRRKVIFTFLASATHEWLEDGVKKLETAQKAWRKRVGKVNVRTWFVSPGTFQLSLKSLSLINGN